MICSVCILTIGRRTFCSHRRTTSVNAANLTSSVHLVHTSQFALQGSDSFLKRSILILKVLGATDFRCICSYVVGDR